MKLLHCVCKTVCTAAINDVLGGDRGYGWKKELATFSQREKKDSLIHAWRHNQWAVGHVEKMTLHENQYSKKTTSNKKNLFSGTSHLPLPFYSSFSFQICSLYLPRTPPTLPTYLSFSKITLYSHLSVCHPASVLNILNEARRSCAVWWWNCWTAAETGSVHILIWCNSTAHISCQHL